MDYTVSNGDSLWSIAKDHYECKNNKEVLNAINKLVEENNIDLEVGIGLGDKIVLPESDEFISTTMSKEKSKAEEFDEWTNSGENYNKAINGEQVDDFKMFELDLSKYSSDLKNFAQEYINMWDSDTNGVWDKSEFISMATGGAGIPEEYKEEYTQLFDQLYDNLNLDEDKESISAEEFASYLYTTDVDWDNFKATNGDVASSIDGKINYMNYQTFSALEQGSEQYENLQYQKESFFNNFYAA